MKRVVLKGLSFGLGLVLATSSAFAQIQSFTWTNPNDNSVTSLGLPSGWVFSGTAPAVPPYVANMIVTPASPMPIGSTVAIAVSGVPKRPDGSLSPADWVAIVPKGSVSMSAPCGGCFSWAWVATNTANTVSPPTVGVASNTVTLKVPSTPGNYEIRYYFNNGFFILNSVPLVTQ